ncbi:LysR family transcriptional regulator [Oleispirillum naphthae]|uniref:LysR family transcriptional regulator n=1 Tax=Oleispirillum naphthae TaxID=2838853 RepID=UPI0030823155
MAISPLLRKLDFVTLKLFISVCEEGNLTHAAEHEAIAPSAVSKRLADLEAALGVALFVRQARGMALTMAGQTLLYHSRTMLQNVESIGIELGEYAQGVRGYVRVLANISSLIEFLPEDLEDFLTLHPEIKVDLAEFSSPKVVEEIENHKADLGICAGDTNMYQLVRTPYRRDRLMVVLRPDHKLASERSLSFGQTLGYDYVCLHSDSSIFTQLLVAARQTNSPLRVKIHVTSFDALCRMVQANLGIGIMPDRAFEVVGQPLGLCAVGLTDPWARRELMLVCRNQHVLSPASKMLFDYLAAVGKSAPRRNPSGERPAPDIL